MKSRCEKCGEPSGSKRFCCKKCNSIFNYYKNQNKKILYQREYDKKNTERKRLYDRKRWGDRRHINHIQKYSRKHHYPILLEKFNGCQICGSKEILQIHHKKYTKSIKDCMLLCQKHHKDIHRKHKF